MASSLYRDMMGLIKDEGQRLVMSGTISEALYEGFLKGEHSLRIEFLLEGVHFRCRSAICCWDPG